MDLMKKHTSSQNIIRIARLKKHEKNSLSAKRRVRRARRLKKEIKNKKFELEQKNIRDINLPNSYVSNEMEGMCSNSNSVKKKDLSCFTFPANFDIFSNPELVFKTVDRLRSVLLHPKLKKLTLNHKKVRSNSLGSEAILGILASEIINDRRDSLDEELPVYGTFPKDKIAKEIVKSIGLVCELDSDEIKDASSSQHHSEVHLFRADNKYHQNVSVKNDKKRKVAKDCVDYLEECMNTHKLTINIDAQNRMNACLGEVLDNVGEHCGRTKSVWYVRSYFNDVRTEDNKGQYLELMVLNLGNSISDNFVNLSEDSKVKKTAMVYVDRHSDSLPESALLTVAALQGNMSSKRDKEPSRGQGSVTLIETFESIYQDYCTLRDPNGISNSRAKMNIISGDTVITFDGKYKSKVVDKPDGSEVFQMAFNDVRSLKKAPDRKYVYTMNDVKFPGLMINISIPLKGSTKPLEGITNE